MEDKQRSEILDCAAIAWCAIPAPIRFLVVFIVVTILFFSIMDALHSVIY